MDVIKPYILAMTIVFIYTGMYVVSKAAFDDGMNSFVFVFYRQATASLLLLPITLLLQRKKLGSLSKRLLLKLFSFSFIGNTLSLNLCYSSMTLTTATVASASANTIPVITFCLALLFRMEVVKLRGSSGIAKVAGIVLCLAGCLIIACYTGPSLSPVNNHRAFGLANSHSSKAPKRGMWILGIFLILLSNFTWSLWMVLQAWFLKEYRNKLLMTTALCVFGAMQSFLVAVVAESDFAKWRLSFDISLLAILYNGIVVTGVSYYLQAWCLEIKGPVFLASIWNPLTFIMTIFCSSFFLGEIVNLGSIVGGVLLVGGLYSVLWGKSKEESKIVACSDSTVNADQDARKEKNTQEEELHEESQDSVNEQA